MRLVVLASGRGSNLQAILDSIQVGLLEAEVVAVISDKPSAMALNRARAHGIPAVLIDRSQYKTREDFEEVLLETVTGYSPDYLVLAGFMLLLSESFISHFPNRILNIHPSLLPAFPGLNPQRQAIDYGVRFSGCTVHFVDAGTDSGPIILQAVVPVFPEDTPEVLAARILVEEHRLYPLALQLLAEGRVVVEGRKVLIIQPEVATGEKTSLN